MGITGLIPFLEKASRKANVGEFSGCTVAVDTYCWLHKGAFACADKLVRGEDTDIHIKYCLKYVTMLLSRNIKPILVFDGRHLPAKALTESKRRESRQICKKRAAELLSLGKIDEARSLMRRSVDITHAMALELIKECRKRNVDCIVAPYEADAQLAYLNINNIAQLVITEDSDLLLFGCNKVLFKMDLDGTGTLVEAAKIPLAMNCPIERYTFDKFRQMCIMSGCDYLASLPGIGLAKAKQFVTSTQDPNFANALRKLPSFFNRLKLLMTDDYRENFLKAEATFKHQYVYDPIDRKMVRLTDPDDADVERALCVNAGEILDPKIAFQLALGNLDPFTLRKMDDWHPDNNIMDVTRKTNSWKEKSISTHPSIWSAGYNAHLTENKPWSKRVTSVQPIIPPSRTRFTKKMVTLPSRRVEETQDESLSIESLSKMYSVEPANKKQKTEFESQCSIEYSQNEHNIAVVEEKLLKNVSMEKERSPILENRERSFKKGLRQGSYSVLKKLSGFPRTVLDENVIESKFFNSNQCEEIDLVTPHNATIEESPEKRIDEYKEYKSVNDRLEFDTGGDDSELSGSQKENSPFNSPLKQPPQSPIIEPSPKGRNPFRKKSESQMSTDTGFSEGSVVDNSYPINDAKLYDIDAQISDNDSSKRVSSQTFLERFEHRSAAPSASRRATCRVSGLKRSATLPANQPTLLSKFGFQKKPVLRR